MSKFAVTSVVGEKPDPADPSATAVQVPTTANPTNITLAPVQVRRLGRLEADARALSLLERVGIPDKAQAYPAQLSGGEVDAHLLGFHGSRICLSGARLPISLWIPPGA